MALVPSKRSFDQLESPDANYLSCDSLAAMAESQRHLFHSQIDQLQKLVLKQCQLTGVNPLAQEMAAGAFSIKLGKKPKDLLNPKAVKYMQSVFSLKDNIGKRETREISALCGVTVRQVIEFFTSQRSRVRKFIRLSREKASRLESSKTPADVTGPAEGVSVDTETVGASISVRLSVNNTEADVALRSDADGALRSVQKEVCVSSEAMAASRTVQEVVHVGPEAVGVSGYIQTEGMLVNAEGTGALKSVQPAQPVGPLRFVLKEGRWAKTEAASASKSVQKVGVNTQEAAGASRSVQKVGVNTPEAVGASRSVQEGACVNSEEAQKKGVCVNAEEAVGALRSVQEGDVGPASLREGEGVGINEEDKKIVEDMIGIMSKETSFSGQVRLMESVIRINNETVLSWFIEKEGLSILLKWLAEAATEEQTSVILVIFKVLCHLPLNKALTTQISAILQAINRLRFYRTSDISNRAKVLLSKWSKLLRSQLLKKNPNDSQKDLIRKQRIRELLGHSLNSEVGIPDGLALTENGDDKIIPENKKTLRLLNAPYEDSTKRNGTGSSVLKNKVRRKVLLVDNPSNRNNQNVATSRVVRSAHPTNSRPLSADDIQKAKLRASYIQQKHGIKPDLPKSDEKPKLVHPVKRPVVVNSSVDQPDIDPLNLMERLSRAKIPWRAPPEVKIDPTWQVCTGENSKECSIQAQRTRRGSEIFYPDPLKIPPNPKDPWDKELDFDDTLTPEIPIHTDQEKQENQEPQENTSTELAGLSSGPDMELLAVLLKNPDLVFALTSGQGTGLSSEQTVSLLDMLKNSGLSLSDLANGLASSKSLGSGSGNESLPSSLPSPTPLERANLNSLQSNLQLPSPVVASATNHYNSVVSAFNVQNQSNLLSQPQMSVSMNLPPQHYTSLNNTQQNPYLGQNFANVPSQPWDQNAGYLVQNGYNNNNNNVMPGNLNQNQNQSQYGSGTDMWGQGKIGESSAVWGYNDQRRNYNHNNNNGQGWRR